MTRHTVKPGYLGCPLINAVHELTAQCDVNPTSNKHTDRPPAVAIATVNVAHHIPLQRNGMKPTQKSSSNQGYSD